MVKTLMSSLDEAIQTIEGFEFAVEVPRLEQHNRQVGKDYIAKHPDLSKSIATFQFSSITSIPSMARRMKRFIEEREGTPGECCALAAVLWYIGNPDDVLPDNENGCVGFLDDAAILNHVAGEFLLPILQPQNITRQQLDSVFDFVCLGIPKDLYHPLTEQIDFISMLIQVCLDKPDDSAERLLHRFLGDMGTLEQLSDFLNSLPKPPRESRIHPTSQPATPQYILMAAPPPDEDDESALRDSLICWD